MSIECLATAIQAACAVTWGPKTPVADRETYLALASEVAKNYDAGINTMACGEGPDRRPKPERTPEVVLRAMLANYEKAATEDEIAAHRKWPVRYRVTLGQWHDAVQSVRLMLTNFVVNDQIPSTADWPTPIVRDYEARLAGTRPLDAPPLEAL